MFTPSASREDIIDYVVDVVRRAGSNPCPPMVIGVGIGGDFEQCALLAKKALCRQVSEPNADEYYAAMESEILEKANALNIGPQGFGGRTTALSPDPYRGIARRGQYRLPRYPPCDRCCLISCLIIENL